MLRRISSTKVCLYHTWRGGPFLILCCLSIILTLGLISSIIIYDAEYTASPRPTSYYNLERITHGLMRFSDVDLDTSNLMLVQTSKMGLGVTTSKPIHKGSLVAVYGGEYIDDPASVAQLVKQVEDSTQKYVVSSLFVLKIDDNTTVCLDPRGSKETGIGKYFNHSRLKPNMEAIIISFNGFPNVGFFASREIQAGEELFFDYGAKNDDGSTAWLDST